MKWEYKWFCPSKEDIASALVEQGLPLRFREMKQLEAMLNRLGQQGWEVISIDVQPYNIWLKRSIG